MQDTMENGLYKTKDLYLVSYLVLSGIKITKLERGDRNRFFFFFESNTKLQELADLFYARKATVTPQEYAVAMKQVKSMMYNELPVTYR